MDNKTLGNIGEDLAVRFLEKKGMKILQRNFRYGKEEIDIIVYDPTEEQLIFVEVKTRRSQKYGLPEQSVNWSKQKAIQKVARYYIYKHYEDEPSWKISIVPIEIVGRKVVRVELVDIVNW